MKAINAIGAVFLVVLVAVAAGAVGAHLTMKYGSWQTLTPSWKCPSGQCCSGCKCGLPDCSRDGPGGKPPKKKTGNLGEVEP